MVDKTLYCKTHLLSVVGRDSNGNIYQRCYQGLKNYRNGVDEKCSIQIAQEHLPTHQTIEDKGKTYCVDCEAQPTAPMQEGWDKPY